MAVPLTLAVVVDVGLIVAVAVSVADSETSLVPVSDRVIRLVPVVNDSDDDAESCSLDEGEGTWVLIVMEKDSVVVSVRSEVCLDRVADSVPVVVGLIVFFVAVRRNVIDVVRRRDTVDVSSSVVVPVLLRESLRLR